jgi:predicted acyltransferase
MTTVAVAPAAKTAQQAGSNRIVSIDIFRGLTMAVMIFVNELADVHGLPQWTRHMPAKVDAMSYVDMVFPFFLFIVGLSLPLAVRHRLKKNPSIAALWLHILLRSVSLIVLGLILANAELGDPARMGISHGAWALLALTGGVLFWNVYPGLARNSAVVRGLRGAGLLLMIAMFAIFRRTVLGGPAGPGAHAAWIDFAYPEILGLIGITYFAVAILYIPTRQWLWAPLAWFVALVTLNCLSIADWISFPTDWSMYAWPFSNGAHAAITMAGVAVSAIFLGQHRWQAHRYKTLLAVLFGLACLTAGWFLTPLGISKIRATPTWALYSAGAATLIFALLHWVADVRKQSAWAAFVRSAGSNTLMTYLLPDFYIFFITFTGFLYFESHWSAGWPGVVKSVVFTGCILFVSWVVTRLRVRMQL